jgi:S-adenosylmethionine hydrolase
MRSNNSSIKKQKADKRAKKRIEKFNTRLEKKNNPKKDFESMIAYVDKFGNITSEPPVETGTVNESEAQ